MEKELFYHLDLTGLKPLPNSVMLRCAFPKNIHYIRLRIFLILCITLFALRQLLQSCKYYFSLRFLNAEENTRYLFLYKIVKRTNMGNRTMFKHHQIIVEISVKLIEREKRQLYFQAGVIIEVGRDAQKPTSMLPYVHTSLCNGTRIRNFLPTFIHLEGMPRSLQFTLLQFFSKEKISTTSKRAAYSETVHR